VTFRDVPISVAATWSPSKRAQANIGLELLGRFRMAVDHARDRLHLAPGPDLHRAFRKNRSGLRAQFAVDRLRVVHVSPGSPAERAGWKPGEEIVAIDGAALDSGFPNSPRAYWGAGKAGTTVMLSMADGQTRRLTLEDYF
jgi:predicted metalloprotease with PDZ domain